MEINISATLARHALGVATPARYTKLCGVELAYSDSEGSGLPIVCLHAIGHGARDFVPLRDRLDPGYRFITLDWPGQGRSGDDALPASADRYTDILSEFLDDLEIERPVLLGNSIGAAAAIQYAARDSERVLALVLANPGGLAPVDLMTRVFARRFASFFRAGSRDARWFRPAFRAYYRRVLQGEPAGQQRQRIEAACYEIAPVLAQAWTSFTRADADLRARARQITCPILFTWAKNDQIVSYARSRAAIESLPTARVEFFEAGHSAFLEDPDAFASAFGRFLASLQS